MNDRELLGVSNTADASEIKQAFRNAAKELHPDHSNSPEAAEAFARIKEAHDALLKEAETPRESTTVQAAAAYSAAATIQAVAAQQSDDTATDATVKATQELDEAVLKADKKSLFKRNRESEALKKHRKKLKTNDRRLRGLY